MNNLCGKLILALAIQINIFWFNSIQVPTSSGFLTLLVKDVKWMSDTIQMDRQVSIQMVAHISKHTVEENVVVSWLPILSL